MSHNTDLVITNSTFPCYYGRVYKSCLLILTFGGGKRIADKERHGDHQKLKMLYLAKFFSEETDDQHPLTMPEIIKKLSLYGVNADRKTLYLDFAELRDFGLDIIAEQVSQTSAIISAAEILNFRS